MKNNEKSAVAEQSISRNADENPPEMPRKPSRVDFLMLRKLRSISCAMLARTRSSQP